MYNEWPAGCRAPFIPYFRFQLCHSFFVLNVIQIAKNIGPSHFIKIADSGKILRLMHGNDQFGGSFVLFLDLLGLDNDKIID
jgi:hypothetical protein